MARIPLHTQVSDEEYRLFHSIDRALVSTLIYSLACSPFDALSVVAFLLWLERNMLSANAVYRVYTDWSGTKISRLADQVVDLLDWLENSPADLVWETGSDISLIQELCNQNVGFVELHQRRSDILEGKTEIMNEISRRGFNNMFGDFENTNVGGGFVNDPREFSNNNLNGFEFGSASGGSAAGPVHGPRGLWNYNPDGAGFEYGATGIFYGPREVENNSGVEFVAGPVLDRQEVENNVLNGVGFQNSHSFILAGGFVNEPFRNINGQLFPNVPFGHQRVRFVDGGVAGGFVNGPFRNINGQRLPNVPFGQRVRFVDTTTNGENEMENTRRPIPDNELCVLLRGLNVHEEETDVQEEDRTVFLTFSRGYPISEPEIRGFFTRKFGNFIKRISFEGVELEGEQPLYARMVVHNSSILPLICDVTIRTKYMINGKPVWAKKYVTPSYPPPPVPVDDN